MILNRLKYFFKLRSRFPILRILQINSFQFPTPSPSLKNTSALRESIGTCCPKCHDFIFTNFLKCLLRNESRNGHDET